MSDALPIVSHYNLSTAQQCYVAFFELPVVSTPMNITVDDFMSTYQVVCEHYLDDVIDELHIVDEIDALAHLLANPTFQEQLWTDCKNMNSVTDGLCRFVESDMMAMLPRSVQAEIMSFFQRMINPVSFYHPSQDFLLAHNLSLVDCLALNPQRYSGFILTEEGNNDHAYALLRRLEKPLLRVTASNITPLIIACEESRLVTLHPNERKVCVLHSTYEPVMMME